VDNSPLLGRRVEYPTRRDPLLLRVVERQENRRALGIAPALFRGFDAWHAREAGFITARGLPVNGILKIVYPADTPLIIESKSLKLYLNSLNMEPFGDTPREGIPLFLSAAREDISGALQSPVRLALFTRPPRAPLPFDFGDDYRLLERNVARTPFTLYRECPDLLLDAPRPGGSLRARTHLLRSNCKITGQPDWGSLFVRLTASRLPSPLSLLRYIVSLRAENHFHEEICETIYKRLHDAFAPRELAVTCLYTRRGGIDICPSRASHPGLLPALLADHRRLTRPTFQQ
jgi:7-cyano-7-deazaguanine reductase